MILVPPTQHNYFVQHLPTYQPQIESERARSVWHRALNSFEAAMPLTYTVRGTLGSFHIRMDHGSIREDTPSGSVSYSGGWAMVKTHKIAGKAKGPIISLVPLGVRGGLTLEPSVRAWAYGESPLSTLPKPGMKLRLMGAMNEQGTRCDILQLRNGSVRIDIVIRHRDGLPLRIDGHSMDGRGRDVGIRSTRVFRYLTLGSPIPKSAFVLKPG